jgi:sugar lactone lactonase YvrE
MIKVFSNEKCSLGEGPLWHNERNSLFWVDINNKRVFEKKLSSSAEGYDNFWPFEFMVSALAKHATSSNKLWLVTESGLILLDILTGNHSMVITFPITDEFRTNDASVAPDGKLWFGTMQKKPTATLGAVYSIDANGKLIKQLSQIGIPNTIQWLGNDKLYISDSLKQKMYLYNVQTKQKEIVIDLTNGNATPDGGAFNSSDELWNAQWDGSRIACYDQKGQLLQELAIPVPRPTSCCFGGEQMDKLFITSASEGLSKSQTEKFPLSGQLFIVETGNTGKEVPAFNFCEELC